MKSDRSLDPILIRDMWIIILGRTASNWYILSWLHMLSSAIRANWSNKIPLTSVLLHSNRVNRSLQSYVLFPSTNHHPWPRTVQNVTFTKTGHRPDMISKSKERKWNQITPDVHHYCQWVLHLSMALLSLVTLHQEETYSFYEPVLSAR
jgi:hypothetical protein